MIHSLIHTCLQWHLTHFVKVHGKSCKGPQPLFVRVMIDWMNASRRVG